MCPPQLLLFSTKFVATYQTCDGHGEGHIIILDVPVHHVGTEAK